MNHKAKIKVTDFIAAVIEQAGARAVFGVQGGAVVHVFDSLERRAKTAVCYTHHEQAAALAAVSNARKFGKLGCCVVTTGPAATNAITGLLSAWQDSVPVLFISGQSRSQHTSYGLNVRQVGSQECNILDVVAPWCKYCALLDDARLLPEILIRAIRIATTGRKGPVWVDLPLEVQWLEYDIWPPIELFPKRFPESASANYMATEYVLSELETAARPLFVFGRVDYENEDLAIFFRWLHSGKIPSVFTWGSATLSQGRAANLGILGPNGQPAANFGLRAADLIIFLGCHFSLTQSGYDFTSHTESQKMVFINIDDNQLNHIPEPPGATSVGFSADVNDVIRHISEVKMQKPCEKRTSWWLLTQAVTETLSPRNAIRKLAAESQFTPHEVIAYVYDSLDHNDTVVIDGGGCALYSGFQTIPTTATFDVQCSTAISAMGTGLPELIGCRVPPGSGGRCICVIGDGSLMFNVQELQSIQTYMKNATILVVNNGGYLAIRHTQAQFLNKRFMGTTPNTGRIDFPSTRGLAKLFGFTFFQVNQSSDIPEVIDAALAITDSPTIVELNVDHDHQNLFTATHEKDDEENFIQSSLDRMAPFQDLDLLSIASDFGVNIRG